MDPIEQAYQEVLRLEVQRARTERFRVAMRLVYMLAVLTGFSFVVFWRGESAWLFGLALAFIVLGRRWL